VEPEASHRRAVAEKARSRGGGGERRGGKEVPRRGLGLGLGFGGEWGIGHWRRLGLCGGRWTADVEHWAGSLACWPVGEGSGPPAG
jgi:hypothetical protein